VADDGVVMSEQLAPRPDPHDGAEVRGSHHVGDEERVTARRGVGRLPATAGVLLGDGVPGGPSHAGRRRGSTMAVEGYQRDVAHLLQKRGAVASAALSSRYCSSAVMARPRDVTGPISPPGMASHTSLCGSGVAVVGRPHTSGPPVAVG
jgi:hypothetical protein